MASYSEEFEKFFLKHSQVAQNIKLDDDKFEDIFHIDIFDFFEHNISTLDDIRIIINMFDHWIINKIYPIAFYNLIKKIDRNIMIGYLDEQIKLASNIASLNFIWT